MKRRNLMIGVGSSALGLSALVGSGAFSTAEMHRDANINVVADENGLLALEAGLDSDTVTGTGDGELVIDTGLGDEHGLNTNSVYWFGEFLGDFEGPLPGDDEPEIAENIESPPVSNEEFAFKITNNDTVPHDVTIVYTPDDDLDSSGIGVAATHWDDEGPEQGAATAETDDHPDPLVLEGVESGDYITVLFAVFAGEVDDDLDGTFSIYAGEADVESPPPEEDLEGPEITSFSLDGDTLYWSIEEGDAPLLDEAQLDGSYTDQSEESQSINESIADDGEFEMPDDFQLYDEYELTLTVEDENGKTDSETASYVAVPG